LNSNEIVKVVGTLSGGASLYSEKLKLANEQMKNSTSLTEEYNVKNNTTQAMLEKAKNNMDAFSITMGNQLIPILTDFLNQITPVISAVADFAKNNSWLAPTIMVVAGALWAISLAAKAYAAAQWLINVAMSANPIGLIIIAIVALI